MNSDKGIEYLNLSVKTYNCLLRANITTISRLYECSRNDLKRVRNLGIKGIAEIEEKLFEFTKENEE